MKRTLQTVIEDETYTKLKKIANGEMRTVSDWVRVLILKEIRKREKTRKTRNTKKGG